MRKKKPFYKRWWFIAIVIFVVIGAIVGGDEDEVDTPSKEMSEVEELETNNESEKKLSDAELKSIIEKTKEQMLADQDFEEYKFKIDSYEFNQEENTLNTTIVITEDPLPTKKEAEEYTDDLAWSIGTTTSDKDFNVKVISALKFEENEYAHLGTAMFKDGETTFKGGEALEILD